VGQKQANEYRLRDMSGNVMEWTSDCYNGDSVRCIIRGGSWNDSQQGIRAANRISYDSSGRLRNFGFRLARTLFADDKMTPKQRRLMTILEDELSTEQMALNTSRQQLKEAQDSRVAYKTSNSPIDNNVDKYEEKLKALQEEVSEHEKNIESLKTMLAKQKSQSSSNQ
jgi:hypothetical protein